MVQLIKCIKLFFKYMVKVLLKVSRLALYNRLFNYSFSSPYC